ncbi:MAG: phospholipid carrier-dependent glycosyltransferase [Patescibacteria group bacterium]|nr:phospholipid carrier-dependent glycosyltransferase [Patescibacteria group bacterium]
MTLKAFFQKNWVILTLILIVVASFLLRLWHLGKIGDQIFDEVYFVKFAQNYLTGTSFFDIHPPLGKLIIAFGLKFFGDTSFTWRLMPAIFGTLLIILGYFTGKELSSKRVGLYTASIMALDGMLLVYSRTGLIDIFLIFFILLAFYFFLKFINTQKFHWIILTGIAVGLAASVKYIGALILIVFGVMIFTKHISWRKNLWKYFIFLGALPLSIYLAFFLFNFGTKNFFAQVYEWQMQSFNYNIGLKDTHPYGSKWWSWFLLLRPIWFYFKSENGQSIGVDGIGNPLAWWSSIVIIPLLIWGTALKYKNHLVILAGFLVFLLFWAPFNRVLFFYHAMPSFIFLTLGISLWLERLVLKYPYGKYYVAIYFCVLFLLFIYFLPIWVGMPLSSDQFYHRIWLKGWI